MAKRTMPKQKPGASEQSVGTPLEFLIAAARKLGIEEFVFDLAAEPHNAICPEYYDETDDALDPSVSWKFDGWAFLNPPFGKIGPWVKKACDEASNGAHVAVLIPAAVGSNWWKKYVHQQARILTLNGRLTFVGHTIGYPKDCALLLYGPNELPGYEPWSWMDDLTDEEKQMAKKRIGKMDRKLQKPTKFKAKTKAGKKAEKIAAGRASKVTNIGSRKRKGAVVDVATTPPEAARVTTFKPNGSTSQGLPSLSEFDPGKIELPSPEDAVKVLGELASLNDQALKAKSRYEELKDYTKAAKEKYDSLMEQVGVRLRQATHKSDLPLFADVEKREADQAVMESGPEAIPETVSEQPPDAGIDEAALAEASEPLAGEVPLPPPAPESPTEALDDDPPF